MLISLIKKKLCKYIKYNCSSNENNTLCEVNLRTLLNRVPDDIRRIIINYLHELTLAEKKEKVHYEMSFISHHRFRDMYSVIDFKYKKIEYFNRRGLFIDSIFEDYENSISNFDEMAEMFPNDDESHHFITSDNNELWMKVWKRKEIDSVEMYFPALWFEIFYVCHSYSNIYDASTS